MNIRDEIGMTRQAHRATVAEAIMHALDGRITPAECMDRVDAAHDDLAARYIRLGAEATRAKVMA